MNSIPLEHRLELTHLVIALLDAWGIREADQVAILGLPDGTKARTIRRYRQDTPLPESDTVMERVDHLVGIADALRTSYPHNPSYGAMWMKRPNVRFNNRAPVQHLCENGLEGMISLRTHLDCSYGWHMDKLRYEK